MKLEQFTRTTKPVTLLAFGDTVVGWKLVDILLREESKVILADELTRSNQKLIRHYSKNENFMFIDYRTVLAKRDSFKRIDYSYILMHHQIQRPIAFTNKELVTTTHLFDELMRLAVEFESKVVVTTSATHQQLLHPLPENQLQLQLHCEHSALDFCHRTDLNVRVLRMAELIGDQLDELQSTQLQAILKEVKARHDIHIFGDGLAGNYVVDYRDAVLGILRALFNKATKGQILTLGPAHPISTLNITYQILELIPQEYNVVFSEETSTAQLHQHVLDPAPSLTKFGWKPRIKIEKSLLETLQAIDKTIFKFNKLQAPPPVSDVPNNLELGSKTPVVEADVKWSLIDTIFRILIKNPFDALFGWMSGWRKRPLQVSVQSSVNWGVRLLVLGILLFGIYYVVSPYLIIANQLTRVAALAKTTKDDLQSMELRNVSRDVKELQERLTIVKSKYQQLQWQTRFWPKQWQTYYSEGQQLIRGEEQFVDSLVELHYGLEPTLEYFRDVQITAKINNPVNNSNQSYATYIQKMQERQASVFNAASKASVAKQELNKVNRTNLPQFVRRYFDTQQQYMPYYYDGVDVAKTLIPHADYLLGLNQRTNYFIMLQNPTEIRSTGGWLSTYAVVGIENGDIKEFSINDVYDTDGKIKGIIAPLEMRTALRVNTMKTSLSNWQPLLSDAHKDINLIYQQVEPGKEMNVVVAANLYLLQDLLKSFGPLTSSQGAVTSDTIMSQITQLHSSFTPGSQNKATFVKEVTEQLLPTAFNKSNLVTTLPVLYDSLRTQDLLLSSSDRQVEHDLGQFGFTGNFAAQTNPLYAVDWNWGGNKADAFITRKYSVSRVVTGTQQTVEWSLTYTNTASQNAYPQGPYMNYLRLYLPANAQVVGVTGLPATTSTEYGLKKLQGFINVPLLGTTTVTVRFTAPVEPVITLIKQPGVRGTLVTYTVNNQLRDSFVLEGKKQLSL